MLAQECQTTDGTWYELQFFEGVDLLVGRFADDGSVAVDEEKLFHKWRPTPPFLKGGG